MKLLKFLGCTMLVMGMVGLLGSIIVPQVLDSKAQMIQRITPYDAETAALTGETGAPLGEPQLMIIDDERAFLKGYGENGVRLVDDAYLKSKNIYPLQVKTVSFVAGLSRLASAILAALGAGALLGARRWQRSANLSHVS